ncbi:MAG: hypothetical protein C0510_07565 [Erythrobacter sp.]|nr:hypothetical protein [Erythrobacter sp.]
MIMDRDQKRTSYSMDDLKTPNIRDMDNAQPRPKPPVHIDHPRLAPTGSVGIRLDRMPPPSQSHDKPKRPSLDREFGKPSKVHQEFKPLAQKSPGKDHDRGR